jgi:diguanylate cyclase (GGDEF)-like protein/PAS domain S-box-containing protein
VSDITPWLEPYVPASGGTEARPADPDPRWKSLEIANPKNERLHRIITLEAARSGILGFLATGGVQRIDAAEVAGEGGRVRIVTIDGAKAVELFLEPLVTARFAVRVESANVPGIWKFWKPEALADFRRTNTLAMGVMSGALLVMVAWLAGLTVLRRAPEAGWAAAALAGLMLLVFGQAVLPLPAPVLVLAVAFTMAAGLRYLSALLNWNHFRRRLAVLFDGIAFAVVGFAAVAAADIPQAWPVLVVLIYLGCVFAGLVAMLDARRFGERARALMPGIAILTAAALLPMLAPADLIQAVPDINLFVDALGVAGAIALTFAVTAPPEPELDDMSRAALTEEGRKAREAEYRYALGLATAHQGLWDWNFEADTLFVSPSVEALLGLEAGSLAASERAWAGLILPEDIAIYADTLNAHRRQGNSSFTLEVRMRHAKGGSRWIQLRAGCIADAQGKAIRCIGVVSDITARKSQDLRKPGDEVPGTQASVMQRNTFLSQLDTILTGMKSGKGRLHGAVLAIDVDRVRAVNDTLGHDLGEKFLAQIAERLDHAAGPKDAVARLGSEEFAVLALGSPGDEDGAEVAQRIRDALTQPVPLAGRDIYPAASIGLALLDPGQRNGADALREAELAMFHAKRAGRGSFEIYQPRMKPRTPDRLMLDTDLRTALERQQIELHYQPIIRLDDNAIAGFEALMRWRHPQRGLLSPADFIPLAEETGLIVPLGSYAVERAAVELRRWQSAFPAREPVFCSVNVSARQLVRQEFFDDVMDIIDRQQPARLSLKLELTESAIMQNPDSMANALAGLKEAGAGLALDDFGTGFSSLAYLQRFPFDTVKIDRSFITDMAHNDETPVVLRAIIRLAHDLDMSVVAEGVETQTEASNLQALQCEFAQGYLFGAPMTANQAYSLLNARTRPLPPSRGLPRPGGSGSSRVPRKL